MFRFFANTSTRLALRNRILDSDLSEGYRFGIKPEEIADMSPKIKNLFSLRNARKMEVHAFRKRNNIVKWGEYIDDTGRTEVQGLHETYYCLRFLSLSLSLTLSLCHEN